jgi:DNA-binding phage protein
MNIDLEKLLELADAASLNGGNWEVLYDGSGPAVVAYDVLGDGTRLLESGSNVRIPDDAIKHIAAASPATVTELVNMVKSSTLDCIADVQAEPEFPGDAPPELMKYIRQCIEAKDEQHLLHMMRMSVSITKKGIQERIAARTGISIEGIFGRVVRDQCSCGEPISVELDCPRRTIRTDKKRPFYPDEGLPDGLDPQNYSEHGSSTFRCRKCGEPVGETVPAAKYGVTA